MPSTAPQVSTYAELMLKLSAPQLALYHSGNERNLFSGGQGSGKTHCLGMLSYMYAFNTPKAIQLIGANTNSQLIKSTLKRVYDVWALMGLKKNVHYVVNNRPPKHFIQLHPELDSYDHVIMFSNGAMIFTASLENYTAIDGIEIAVAHLDETKDTREEAVKEVIIGRLRQQAIWTHKEKGGLYDYPIDGGVGFNPLYVYTSPAKSPWLADFFGLTGKLDDVERVIYSAETFFQMDDEANNRTVVISSTYHNQHNLPVNYIPNLLNDLKGRPHLVNMLVYGSPIAKSGGEFFSCFDRAIHVKHFTTEQKLDKSLPIHITFDFNVRPYMTAQIWQVHRDGYRIIARCVKEYALEHPHNSTEDLCSAIMTDYGSHAAGALYYGDSSGGNESPLSKDLKHNYQVIEKHLRPLLTPYSKKVLKANPSHLRRRDFLNKIFAGGEFDGTLVEIEISSECVKLITDLQFIQETADGHMEKKKVTDKDTGHTYEKYGHQADAMVYFICSAFRNFFNG
jgi:hypothetical protein